MIDIGTGTQVFKNVSCNMLYHLGSTERYSRKNPVKGTLILMYHEIAGELFRMHVEYLKERFEIISLDELQKGIAGSSVPEKALVITFDDGYRSNYDQVFPVVKEFKVPITIYLVTGAVGSSSEFWFDRLRNIRRIMVERNMDTKRIDGTDFKNIPEAEKNALIEELAQKVDYRPGERTVLDWAEVAEMHNSGLVTFGAHTHTHPILLNIDDDQVKEELRLSRSVLEKKLRNKIKHFAYPNGNYLEKHIELVDSAGFVTSTTTNPGVNTNRTNPYLLYRIGVGTTNSVPVLAVKTSALWYKLNKLEFDWKGSGRKEHINL